MRYCNWCGKEFEDDSLYCTTCGRPTDETALEEIDTVNSDTVIKEPSVEESVKIESAKQTTTVEERPIGMLADSSINYETTAMPVREVPLQRATTSTQSKMPVVIAAMVLCLALGAAMAYAAIGVGGVPDLVDSSSDYLEEDPWVETLVQEGYRWNDVYEGVVSETEKTYDVDEGKIVSEYYVMRYYSTAHSHSNNAAFYRHFWGKDVQGNYTKEEFGYIEEGGSKVEEGLSFDSYEYDDRDRIVKHTTSTQYPDGSTITEIEQVAYDSNGEHHTITSIDENGESSYSFDCPDNDVVVKSNSQGDKLYYEINDSGNLSLSSVEICDNKGRVLYNIGESPYESEELSSSFDTELNDVRGCLITGYAYDSRDNVIEIVVWDDDEIKHVVRNCYENNGRLLYSADCTPSLESTSTIKTYQYYNYRTGEKTNLLDPQCVEVQLSPILVQPLPDYLIQR